LTILDRFEVKKQTKLERALKAQKDLHDKN
jgi:hypothetical protein